MVLRRACPAGRHLPTKADRVAPGAILTKCCLLETHIEVDDGRVVVPWGASLAQISEALTALAARVGADVGTRLSDSEQYAHLWGTPELAAVFEERARLQSWLDILAALAAAQARLGIIPAEAATQIATHARAERLDLDLVASETRRTSHSTLGLIQRAAAGAARSRRGSTSTSAPPCRTSPTPGSPWSCATSARRVARPARDRGPAARAGRRAPRHAHGRAHPRPARRPDHVRLQGRVLGRRGSPPSRPAAEGRRRWLVGQLGGAVGRAGFYAPRGAELRAEFCAELGLADPGISWLTSRDRIAEFGALLAMVCGTLARIGNEVYELQRPEIGELREPTTADGGRQHHDAAQAQPRGQRAPGHPRPPRPRHAAVLIEGMVAGHERDGRGWKAEWVALPEVCLLTGAALELALRLLAGLVVDARRCAATSTRYGDQLASEQMLAGLTRRLGEARRPAAHARGARAGAATSTTWSTRWSPRASPRSEDRRGVDDLGGRRCRQDGRRRGRPRPRCSDDGAGPMDLRQSPDPPRWLPADPAGARAAPGARARVGAVFVKRDDLTGFGIAGNKARALEYLLGDGRPKAPTSSSPAAARPRTSVAAAAMAARVAGMDCELLVSGEAPSGPITEPRARARCGSPVALRRGRDPRPARRRCRGAREDAFEPRDGGPTRCRAAERPPPARSASPMPRGAGRAVPAGRITPRTVVVATGSGGTQAGLVAGQVGCGLPWRLVGASGEPAGRGMAEQSSAGAWLCRWHSASTTHRRRCRRPRLPRRRLRHRLGRGPDQPRLALQHEGLLLDDYYGAKAMALFRTLLGRRAPRRRPSSGTPAAWPSALAALAGSSVVTHSRCGGAARPRAGPARS